MARISDMLTRENERSSAELLRAEARSCALLEDGRPAKEAASVDSRAVRPRATKARIGSTARTAIADRVSRRLSRRERSKLMRKGALGALTSSGARIKAVGSYSAEAGSADGETDEAGLASALSPSRSRAKTAGSAPSEPSPNRGIGKPGLRKRARDARRAVHRAAAKKKVAARAAASAAPSAGAVEGAAARAALSPRPFTAPAAKAAVAAAGPLSAAMATLVPIALVIAMSVGAAVGSAVADDGSWGTEGLTESERYIALFLKARGLDKVHVAAIMGNLAQESGCDPSAKQVPGMIGGGIGLAQWGYGVDGGRGNAMERWARAVDSDWDDIAVQMDWLWAEMCDQGRAAGQTSWYSPELSPGRMSEFVGERDLAKAVEIWQLWIEAAGDPHMDRRIEMARRYLSVFNKGAGLGAGGNQAVVDAALSQIGVPYVWGASDPGVGMDCSGLVSYAYAMAGAPVTRTTYSQYAQCTLIDASEARPGDLVFMMFSAPGVPEHVGIYIGGGQMVHAPTGGARVRVDAAGWVYADAVYARIN